MMTPTLCTCTWLLLPCCVLISLSTGELDFYRDEVPESPENIALMEYRARQLVDLLEAQNHRQQHPRRAFFSPLVGNQAHKRYHLDAHRQKERDLLNVLTDKALLAEILRQKKAKEWNYRQTRYNEPINELPQEREHYLPIDESSQFENQLEFLNFKLPYFSRHTNDQDANYEDESYRYDQNGPMKQIPYDERQFDRGMKEEPLSSFHGSYGASFDEQIANDRKIQKPQTTLPEFTYHFDDTGLNEKHPFAVKPNNPKFYQDGPFFLGDNDKLNIEKTFGNRTKWEEESNGAEKSQAIHEEHTRNRNSKFKDTSMITLSEIEQRTGYSPLVVPVNRDLNNDIYFIAIVAGCSAAAMFALVLIALTWCRLKRGAKAAADIEYPAYGITGPNKEISPSGDQRLAQSAQMYHFQHQKQQIIAMENRVSATRDPGSISEAESEEENEEGDYTVYECPGLASTGEMEVKNPLFHDDPTPATPAQTNKEEDHM
nr:PREDICTED: uncharacterized protein LOC100879801 isoform X1 [Megachile rotundata]